LQLTQSYSKLHW